MDWHKGLTLNKKIVLIRGGEVSPKFTETSESWFFTLKDYLAEPGTTVDAAITKFGVPRTTLRAKMERAGIYKDYLAKRKREARAKQDQVNTRNNRILALVKTGLTYTQVAKEFGLGRETVRKIAVKTGTRAARKRLASSRHPIDEVLFAWAAR